MNQPDQLKQAVENMHGGGYSQAERLHGA